MTGTVLGARYEILEQFDSGGMADIYRAFCRKTKTVVAVKMLKECFSDNTEYIDRFKQEAETVFSLDHPNIVRVMDIGYDEGAYYMVMEYIEGSTLKNIISQRSVDEKEAVGYAIQICSALAAAHKKGIIHRDIKPQNILIDKDGNVKLTDFGIAKSISTKEERANQVIGSVHYISPEQARGERVDTRTDIYSLGIVLYEMLTGVLPHTSGETVSVALKHINEQITPPAEVNEHISQSVNYIVLKATGKNKRERYQSMDDFKNDLVLSLADPDGAYIDMPTAYRNVVKKPVNVKKKNMFWKAGMLFLLVAVIASLVVTAFIVFNPSSQQAFTVPNFVGSSLESSERSLDNLSVTTTYESSESAKEGTIISQSPEAGSKTAKGEPITLTISSGPSGLVMPDLYGLTLEEARAQLKSMGLDIDDDYIAYDYLQDTPPGMVISQTPEAETPLTETYILGLTVSSENPDENAMMPGLNEKLADQAVSLLKDAGFKKCFVYEEDSELPEGTVIRQTPEQGIQTSYTENVYITISRYKTRKYSGRFSVVIDITEKESKVQVVLQETINGETINFVEKEINGDIGRLPLNLDLSGLSGGSKKVTVYVNNQEAYSGEVVIQ
jgi:serine/threonine protein kinase